MRRHAFLLGSSAALLSFPRTAAAAGIYDEIVRIAESSSGELAMYARKLGSDEPLYYNADTIFPAASVIKLCILVSLFQLSEKEDAGFFDRTIVVHQDDFIGGSDVLQNYRAGDALTLGTLARAMIEQSDNTASNLLITYLGFDRINHTIRAMGLKHTQLKRHFLDTAAIIRHIQNLTSAHDIGALLYHIEFGAHEGIPTVASPVSCRHMIDILLRQEDRDKIARGLPKGTPLANKTGEIDGVRNDVGIIDPYGEAPYVLAVLTKNLYDFSLGNRAIRRIAKVVNGAFG